MSTQTQPHSSQSRIGHAHSLSQLANQYSTFLEARGHTQQTSHAYLESIHHFFSWLAQELHGSNEIDAHSVREFLREHLPVCQCQHPAPRHVKTVRAALNQLLLMLGQDRIHASDSPASAAIEASLLQFDAYLRDVCGLAPITRHSRCRYVKQFLTHLFGDKALVYECIDAAKLINFITQQGRHYQPATLGAVAGALRSYLRFLQFTGAMPATMATAIPSPANWRLATLPPCMSEDEQVQFWHAFDRSTAMGKRDYAMARCLTDLALRCQEVAALRLDDIDWRANTLCLKHTKSHRVEQLPLPLSTAMALIDYLRQGRPSTSSRAVFVYHRAPVGEGVPKTTVRGAVRRAYSRAGLAWSGTHILRHTAATRMLQGGASIKAIADVLRHRSIDTTMIYTKVDLPHLSGVAMPWPGLPS
jgi:site-specific recombinase XerD